jgi:phage I-like protein
MDTKTECLSVIVLNAAFNIAEDTAAILKPQRVWGRIAPATGEKNAFTTKGNLLMQRFSKESNDRVVANFESEVLVDREHMSELTSDTTAYAWIDELDSRPDGLYAAFNTTDIGWEALRNRRLRFPSAVFFLDENGYPMKLKSCALTNKHNLKQLGPILNKDSGSATEPGRNPGDGVTANSLTIQQEGEQMKELLAVLGLSETADAPAALNKVKELIVERDTLKGKISDMTKAALNREADEFIAANKAKIKDPAKIKELFVLNKEATVALVTAMNDGAPAPAPQQIRRSDGKLPDGAPGSSSVTLNKETERMELIDQIRTQKRVSPTVAYTMAKSKRPDLFE